MKVFDWVNRHLGPDDRLYVIGCQTGFLRIPREQVLRTYEAHWAGVDSAKDLGAALDAWGITHVLVNGSPREYWTGIEKEWVMGPESPLRGWDLILGNGPVSLYARRSRGTDAVRPPATSDAHLPGRGRAAQG